jgi:DNA mismatch repair protein MutL
MPKIQCLDPHLADLIAAGEVVERPASVVKELTENAIDAGATAVTVEIKRGGMSYIRVTDDGCGIPAEEVETAFLRHATSKIRSEYDLEAIGTLGFRGEALAAIAAVSKVELMTKTPEEDFGTAILLDGGTVRERAEVGCPKGSTMIVRELFYNTPARLKFMKRDAAEGAAVSAVVQHAAMSHPEVSFRYIREGKQELLTPGDGDLRSAVYAVLGREMALGYLTCKGGNDSIQVEGFLSKPVCCRGSRAYQHFFVNGRYVKSRTMMAALEEAYANQKMVGKFPGCVLHLTAKLNSVDVNVHPTKTEVKFVNEKELFDAVYSAVRSTLEAEQGHPDALKEPPAAPVNRVAQQPPKQGFYQTMTAQQFRDQQSPAKGERLVLREPERANTPAMPPIHTSPRARALAREVQQEEPERRVQEEPEGTSAPWTEAPVSPPTAPEEKPVRQVSPVEPDLTVVYEEPEETPPAPEPPPATLPPKEEPAPAQAAPEEAKPEPVPEEEPEEAPLLAEETPAWRIAGEVLNTYIIVEQGDTVYLIDKHAAHERMNFDRFKARDYHAMSQLLLTPVVYRPDPAEGEALLAHLPLLAEYGFEVEDFGGGTLMVRQVPDYLEEGQVLPTLAELAEQLMTTGVADPAAARDGLLHTMACKAAIKGGWDSDPRELEVVAQAVLSGQVRYCPHGRPVAITMTKKQIEKQFKRIV